MICQKDKLYLKLFKNKKIHIRFNLMLQYNIKSRLQKTIILLISPKNNDIAKKLVKVKCKCVIYQKDKLDLRLLISRNLGRLYHLLLVISHYYKDQLQQKDQEKSYIIKLNFWDISRWPQFYKIIINKSCSSKVFFNTCLFKFLPFQACAFSDLYYFRPLPLCIFSKSLCYYFEYKLQLILDTFTSF